MFLLKIIAIIWALPNTLLGSFVGLLALFSGGRCQWRRGCLEFYGGLVTWILSRLLGGSGASAMTLGHTILGQSTKTLEMARDHEHVHVRQYERWGVFFIPAYLGCSLYLMLRGRDSYRENPFEIEAYSKADITTKSTNTTETDIKKLPE